MTIRASAPGKLFLFGEYAVLEGAPALVTAVDSRATIELEIADKWTLSAPQLGLEAYPLGADGQIPISATSQIVQQLALFDAVTRQLRTRGALPPCKVTINTRDFFFGNEKLGLGSSAAVTVALTGAYARLLKLTPTANDIYQLAATAHREAQGGIGSNADIAASVYGGTLIHRMHDLPQAVTWPPDLCVLPVFTGNSASTPGLVTRIRKLREQEPAVFEQHMHDMTELATRACDTFVASQTSKVADLAGAYHEQMQALGRAAGVEIVSTEHRRLHRLAADYKVAYKPSGAGGGDIGLLFAKRGVDMTSITGKLTEAGFTPLALALGAPGLQVM